MTAASRAQSSGQVEGGDGLRNAVERDLGEQPLARIMRERGLKPHDLVAASTSQMTHKMVSRACRGRRLTPNVQAKVRDALAGATGRQYSTSELFTY
jgi:hypothetical protein